MAKIEKVTVFCDGPCGGNEIVDGNAVAFVLRRGTEQNRAVDLCDDCAASFNEMYERGTPLRPSGRPRKSSTPDTILARTGGGQVEPVEPVPTGGTVVEVTPTPTPIVSPVVKDPFAEAPVGTGV